MVVPVLLAAGPRSRNDSTEPADLCKPIGAQGHPRPHMQADSGKRNGKRNGDIDGD